MVIVDQQRAYHVLYEQFLTNMTVQQASSQQIAALDLFFRQVKWN
jgi:DNA mismatch repair protein MutL